MDSRSMMIAVLAVAVAVLGYLYWESQQSKVEINVPGVSIKAK
jgi:lipopolysaccharide export system protein LptC